MLTLFPEILFLSPAATALLRIAAALTFAYVVWTQLKRREELSRVRFPLVGKGEWIIWFSVIVEGAIAIALFAGIYTQLAALLGAVTAAKYWYWHKYTPAFAPLARGTSLLLLAITLSLVVTGAGAFAFDLPL